MSVGVWYCEVKFASPSFSHCRSSAVSTDLCWACLFLVLFFLSFFFLFSFFFSFCLSCAVQSVSTGFAAMIFGLAFPAFVKLLLWVIFVDCIGVGIVIAAILWCVARRQTNFCVGKPTSVACCWFFSLLVSFFFHTLVACCMSHHCSQFFFFFFFSVLWFVICVLWLLFSQSPKGLCQTLCSRLSQWHTMLTRVLSLDMRLTSTATHSFPSL